jgi:PAS domain S-box-containing protein
MSIDLRWSTTTAIVVLVLAVVASPAAAVEVVATPAGSETVAHEVVVVLHSYHHGFTWTDNISAGIRDGLAALPGRVELRFEFLDARRIASREYFAEVAALLARKYDGVAVDAVICSDDQALGFMLDQGATLFVGAPLVVCSVSELDPKRDYGREITGLVESIDIEATLATALELHPDTEEIVVITDTTRTGRALRTKAERAFVSYRDEVRFRYLDDLTVDELETETAALSDGSIVLLFIFSRDRDGHVFSHEENLARIRRRCAVPIYAVWEFYLGHGIVGGRLTAGREEGRIVAELVTRILDGESASAIPFSSSPTRFLFDWRELARFDIRQRDLPSGSTVVHRPASVFREYRAQILATFAVIGVLLILVVVLIANTLRRRRAEDEQARFSAILESTSDFVATATPTGRITYLNHAGRKLLGWSPNESLEDKQVRDVHPGWVRRLIRDVAFPVSRRTGIWTGETAITSRDEGEIPVSQVIIAHRSSRGGLDYMSTIMRDLRPRIAAEEALRASEENLQHSQKMEAIGQLAGGVAHDFNNLLTGILGNAELLRRTLPGDSRQARRASEIERAAEKAATLTRQLLTFSRKGNLKTEVVNLTDVVNNVVILLSRSIDRRIEIDREFSADNPKVVGDAAQLENAVLNLAVNARDAMPDGGRLRFAVRNLSLADDAAEIRAMGIEPGPFVELEVSDTGIGIPERLQDKIFEPFFTTKGLGEGTGLGLAMVYGCVRNHRGAISVTSEIGGGTSFGLLLPAAEIETRSGEEHAQLANMTAGEGHILIVDDEVVVRDLFRETLEDLGYEVSTCHDGREAVEFYRREGTTVDLVLLDMIMPRLNGADTFRELKEMNPEVRVLLSSGYSESADTALLIEQGALGFLVKPFTMAELADEIARALRG